MKRVKYLAVLLSGIGWTLSPAWSDDKVKVPETPTVAADDAEAGKPDPAMDTAKAQQLASQFGLTEQQVAGMRQTSKMGWGEIRNLLLISQSVSLKSANTATPLTMDQALLQVQAQRASGMGIGQIADSHNVKLGELAGKDRAHTPADKADRPGRPDKPGKPDKVDRPDKADRPDKPSKPDHPDKPDKPEKPDHPTKGK